MLRCSCFRSIHRNRGVTWGGGETNHTPQLSHFPDTVLLMLSNAASHMASVTGNNAVCNFPCELLPAFSQETTQWHPFRSNGVISQRTGYTDFLLHRSVTKSFLQNYILWKHSHSCYLHDRRCCHLSCRKKIETTSACVVQLYIYDILWTVSAL